MSSSTSQVPNVSLGRGEQIPQLGFGVFLVPPGETERAVARALGGRLPAHRHSRGLRQRGGGDPGPAGHDLAREQVFITTKCPNDSHGYARGQAGPGEEPRAAWSSSTWTSISSTGRYRLHDKYVETWRAFIDMQEEGLTRSIGVSNFLAGPPGADHLGEHGRYTRDQPGRAPPPLSAAGTASGARASRDPHRGLEPARTGRLRACGSRRSWGIADAHGKTPAQVVIRWHLAARECRHPEVGHAGAHRGELRRLRLRPRAERDGGNRGTGRRRTHRPRSRDLHRA